jgi:hypothetical protein
MATGIDAPPPNETVEKVNLQSAFAGQGLIEGPVSRSEGGWRGSWKGKGSVERPKSMDFADIMYQSKQPPLDIHLQFGA